MRQRIQTPAEAAPATKPEIKPFPKCACATKPPPSVLAKSGGRCPQCLLGVHVGLPEMSDADENASAIEKLRHEYLPAMIAGVQLATPAPVPDPGATGPGLGAHLQAKGLRDPAQTKAADAMITAAQQFADSAVAAIDVKVHEGDEISVKLPSERYGEKDSLSCYSVPEVTWTTRVRPGEHPDTARARAIRMARTAQDAERETSKARFLAHLQNAFKA